MGNAHSAPGTPAPHHNRLSKPKTNRNSPSLTSNASASSPVSVSSRYAHLSTKERHQVKARLFSPGEKPATPSSLHNAHDDVIELATHLQRRLSTTSRSNSLSCFGSTRTSAAKLASLSGSKLSLDSSVDLETAIQIVQEVRRTASPEDLAALHEALKSPSTTSSPIEPPASQLKSSRRNSLLSRSTSSLLRRRSLVSTPAVATRNSPVEGSKRTWSSWKTPKLNPEEEAKWTVDKAGKSPLANLSSLDAPQHTESLSPRAQTPGDLEYSHLGSLKLGSLRVMNGAASPAPSGRYNDFGMDANAFDDYFAPSEPYDAPLTMKPTKRRGHGRSKSTVEPPTPPLYRRSLLAEDIRRAKTTSRCGSPPRGHVQANPLFDEAEPEPVRRLRVMNKSADTLADALASQDAAELPSDSTNVELSDEGIVMDENGPYAHDGGRVWNSAVFDEPTSTDGPRTSEGEGLRGVDASTHGPHTPRSTDRPLPRKADSGYSSGGSLRTLQRETRAKGTAPASDNVTVPADTPRSGSAGSNDTVEPMSRISGSEESTSAPVANLDATASLTLQVAHETAARTASHAANGRAFEIDFPKSPMSFTSQLSFESKSSMQKRLQKSQPSMHELPVVQSCEPIPEGSVPAVPEDVRVKFERRLSQTPGMECLTRTYASKDHTDDHVKTHESPMDVVSIRFPSPTPTPDPHFRPPKSSGIEQARSPRPSVRRSLSLFRNKSKARKSEDVMEQSHQGDSARAAVLDLGDIAMSLGRSPYDAAMPTRHQSMLSSAHPHQLGNAMPRARSLIAMDAETAAEFARKRSKDLALLRPPMAQRPRSFHAHERRHDLYEQPPSVPLLPSPYAPQIHRTQVSHVAGRVDSVAQHRRTDASTGSRVRARSTGRGPAVAEIVRQYDMNGRFAHEPHGQKWQPHTRLQNQRRKSIGEGLRQRADVAMVSAATPPMSPQYTGPGIRQLHSYASRRGRHLSHHRGASPSHVPTFLERA